MAPSAESLPSTLVISSERARHLDLEPLAPWVGLSARDLLSWSGRLQLCFEWPREEQDPRELSEIPELRLWCLRADALHPWLPLLLERGGGDLTRYVAMLLPHAFNRNEGIRFAPESLELWITHRLFLRDAWAPAADVPCRQGLGQMAAVLGFELDPQFWATLDGG
jgi:hypothetical protein